MDHAFNIGDTVKVINNGKFYTTYDKVADLMHLTNWLHGRGFELGNENLEGETAEVVAIHNHPLDACITLLGIRMHSTNHEYIISSNGVELIQVGNMEYNGMKVETTGDLLEV